MKYLKKAGNIALVFIFSCMFLTGISIITLYILGFRFMAIQTGSMKNVYDIGTLVIVDKVSADEIKTGDVIAYVTDNHFTVVTHRVIDIDSVNRCFYTKGDMNQSADSSPVLFENLIGKTVLGIPAVGYLIIFAKSRLGRVVIRIVIIAILFLVIQQMIYHRMKKGKKNKDEKADVKNEIE